MLASYEPLGVVAVRFGMNTPAAPEVKAHLWLLEAKFHENKIK